jgi:hypothetical protein
MDSILKNVFLKKYLKENQSRIRRASNDKALQIQLAKELEQVLSLTT